MTPQECLNVALNLERGGADVVIEVAGAENTFQLAWQCARPNAVVTVVALYDKPLITHSFPLSRIDEAYRLFKNKEDGVIKVAVIN